MYEKPVIDFIVDFNMIVTIAIILFKKDLILFSIKTIITVITHIISANEAS